MKFKYGMLYLKIDRNLLFTFDCFYKLFHICLTGKMADQEQLDLMEAYFLNNKDVNLALRRNRERYRD